MVYFGWQDYPPDDLDDLDEISRQLYLDEQPIYDLHVASDRREHGRLAEVLRTSLGAPHGGHSEADVALGTHAASLVMLRSTSLRGGHALRAAGRARGK